MPRHRSSWRPRDELLPRQRRPSLLRRPLDRLGAPRRRDRASPGRSRCAPEHGRGAGVLPRHPRHVRAVRRERDRSSRRSDRRASAASRGRRGGGFAHLRSHLRRDPRARSAWADGAPRARRLERAAARVLPQLRDDGARRRVDDGASRLPRRDGDGGAGLLAARGEHGDRCGDRSDRRHAVPADDR